ncbi:hypothetical protein bcgnr5384_56900 [Bacillus cereus]
MDKLQEVINWQAQAEIAKIAMDKNPSNDILALNYFQLRDMVNSLLANLDKE